MKTSIALLAATAATAATAAAAVGAATPALGNSHLTFEEFAAKHKRAYTSADEEDMRRRIFESNKEKVLERNAAFAAGKSTWWAAVNHFSDRTEDELRVFKAGMPRSPSMDSSITVPSSSSSSPSIDAINPPSKSWMQYQTRVKNQESCGSCWAFATTEVVESHLAIAENNTDPTVLAPRTLVDCMENPHKCGGTGGCEGAIAELGFNFTKDHGLALEDELPYRPEDSPCPTYKKAATCTGYVKNKQNDANALETALANVGPVAVTVAANWASYGGGIYSDGCTNIPGFSCTLDHAVVAVGYTQEYWLVRNSWGSGWGENGYIRLTRKFDNTTFTDTDPQNGDACEPFPSKQYPMGESGILFDTAYPVGVSK